MRFHFAFRQSRRERGEKTPKNEKKRNSHNRPGPEGPMLALRRLDVLVPPRVHALLFFVVRK